MLTSTELAMLAFPAGVTYDPSTGIVSAPSAELLKSAHGLLRLGAFTCRRVKGGIKVYGSTANTHNGYGSVWLNSITASYLRRSPDALTVWV
jgi:hypothetical protein